MGVKTVFVLAVAVIILAACCPADISGTVVDRKYDPAHTAVIMRYSGKTYHATTVSYPDRWILTIKPVIGKGCVIQVSEAVFAACDNGDKFSKGACEAGK